MGARAEIDRRLIEASRSPLQHLSMSNKRLKQGSEGERKMRNRLTGGRKVRMAERRLNRIQGEIDDARLARLKEAIEYLERCRWHNDDLLGYVFDAIGRYGSIVSSNMNGGRREH